MVADGRLRPVRDDEVVAARAVVDEHAADRRLDALARQRLAVELQALAVRSRLAEQLARRAHRGLGRGLCATDAGELGSGLDAAAAVEALAVGRQLHARRAQPVGEDHREAPRDDRLLDPEAAHRANGDLVVDLPPRHPAPPQLVEPELFQRMQLEVPQPVQQRGLHRADHDVAGPVRLDVQERVADGPRHLVAQLRRADRVGEDDDVGQGRATVSLPAA